MPFSWAQTPKFRFRIVRPLSCHRARGQGVVVYARSFRRCLLPPEGPAPLPTALFEFVCWLKMASGCSGYGAVTVEHAGGRMEEQV